MGALIHCINSNRVLILLSLLTVSYYWQYSRASQSDTPELLRFCKYRMSSSIGE